jgi:uncharacterized Tic20 family protein
MTDADPEPTPPAPEPQPAGAPEVIPPRPKRARRVRAVPASPIDVQRPAIEVHAIAQPVGQTAAEPPPPPPAPAPQPVTAAPSMATPPPAEPAGQPGQPAPADAAAPGAVAPGTPLPSAGSTPPPIAGTPPVAPAPAAPGSRKRWWIAACHLAYLLPVHLPGLIVATLIWMWRRGRDPQLADQGREAINMQLTFWLVNLVLGLTILAAPLTVFVWFVGAILCLVAAIQSAGGDRYRYPWILRIIA